jgi:hypothetical protein
MQNTGIRAKVTIYDFGSPTVVKTRTLFRAPCGLLGIRAMSRGGHYVYYRVRGLGPDGCCYTRFCSDYRL